MKTRKSLFISLVVLILAVALLSGCEKNSVQTDTPAGTEASADVPVKFTYQHDPKENPKAMEDIIENPDAVYGFSPNPDSARLGVYAEYDWTDPVVVEAGKQDRIAYHESIDAMYDMLHQLRAEGKTE